MTRTIIVELSGLPEYTSEPNTLHIERPAVRDITSGTSTGNGSRVMKL